MSFEKQDFGGAGEKRTGWETGREADWSVLEKDDTKRMEDLRKLEAGNAQYLAEQAEKHGPQVRERVIKAEQIGEFIEWAGETAKKAAAGIALAALIAGVMLYDGAHSGVNEGPDSLAEQGYKYETVEIGGVSFYGGPNLRSQPYIPNKADAPNTFGRVSDEGVVTLTGIDHAYIVDRGDPNGPWYGFDAEELASALLDDHYISKREAKSVAGDKDGVVWTSGNYTSLLKPEE